MAERTPPSEYQVEDLRVIQRAAECLLRAEYRFARTMPDNPHTYTLRETWADDDEFVTTVETMRRYYESVKFGRSYYKQFYVNGFGYWTMGAAINLPDGAPHTILINRKIRSYDSQFDYVAPKYDRLHADSATLMEHSEVAAILRPYVEAVPDDGLILDVGCGTGWLLDRFPRISPGQYVGIDPSQSMLRGLTAKHPAMVWQTVCCRFDEWYPTDRYDLIVATLGSGACIPDNQLLKFPLLLKPHGKWVVMTYGDEVNWSTWDRLGITEPIRNNMPLLSAMAAKRDEVGHHQIFQGSQSGAT